MTHYPGQMFSPLGLPGLRMWMSMGWGGNNLPDSLLLMNADANLREIILTSLANRSMVDPCSAPCNGRHKEVVIGSSSVFAFVFVR